MVVTSAITEPHSISVVRCSSIFFVLSKLLLALLQYRPKICFMKLFAATAMLQNLHRNLESVFKEAFCHLCCIISTDLVVESWKLLSAIVVESPQNMFCNIEKTIVSMRSLIDLSSAICDVLNEGTVSLSFIRITQNHCQYQSQGDIKYGNCEGF